MALWRAGKQGVSVLLTGRPQCNYRRPHWACWPVSSKIFGRRLRRGSFRSFFHNIKKNRATYRSIFLFSIHQLDLVCVMKKLPEIYFSEAAPSGGHTTARIWTSTPENLSDPSLLPKALFSKAPCLDPSLVIEFYKPRYSLINSFYRFYFNQRWPCRPTVSARSMSQRLVSSF